MVQMLQLQPQFQKGQDIKSIKCLNCENVAF